MSRQVSLGIMKVDGLDVNVGVNDVLVEENRATSAMGHVEAIREKLVVNIFGRLLQGNDMPLSCNLFEGIFVFVAIPPRNTIEITCNQVNMSTTHNGTKSGNGLLGEAFLLGVNVFGM